MQVFKRVFVMTSNQGVINMGLINITFYGAEQLTSAVEWIKRLLLKR